MSSRRTPKRGRGPGASDGIAWLSRYRDRARLPRASEPLPRPGSLSLACPRESNQREGHPAATPYGSVRLGRAFRHDLLVVSKRHRHPCRCPCGPSRPSRTAAEGTHEPGSRSAQRCSRCRPPNQIWHFGVTPVQSTYGSCGHVGSRLAMRQRASLTAVLERSRCSHSVSSWRLGRTR
jgi:hypothetical protein